MVVKNLYFFFLGALKGFKQWSDMIFHFERVIFAAVGERITRGYASGEIRSHCNLG